ncbi:DUF262 domain-containing protein [Rhodoferax sp.]|uniref:DUF262 domain-containing protein n=1 Tax=Rhodoferax sp. TaxID=50421 RepID=UPI0027624F74|nr:DUF262 domain-containing protein [Rhodoferax sp.]
MTEKDFSKCFGSDQPVSLTVSDLAAWRKNEEGSRLLLPPIQRSIVWSNEQITNYWDSLLRGYPAGMMIVHRVEKGGDDVGISGRDADGRTRTANEDDFQLFDGQQRMTAILLGLGTGQMRDSRRLWIDIGVEPNKSSGLKFQLRMTSSGQPFGYRPDAPNQKIELCKRQDKWKAWRALQRDSDAVTPQPTFSDVKGKDIIDAKCAIAFDVVCDSLHNSGLDITIMQLSQHEGADFGVIKNFVTSLQAALASNVILQLMSAVIVANQDEYIRFFTRLGQGGTRLSDDELTYSIIKQQYPEIHDRMKEIMLGQTGRLASEVDLVLAALRVSKTLIPWSKAKEWEVISRPTPSFVSQLKDQERVAVRSKFLELIGLQNQTSILESTLTAVRAALSYNASNHPEGLPDILLAGLPRELIDVLLLFALKSDSDHSWADFDRATFRAFVLYWLFFVYDDAKAALRAFQHAKGEKWLFSQESVRNLLVEFEKEGIAHYLPKSDLLNKMRADVIDLNEEDHLLRAWADRFKTADGEGEKKPGEALRVLSTNSAHIKRALMWLQRDYIATKFPNYDPTSDRDEDLPIDLDHVVPSSIFGFDWRYKESRLDLKTYPSLGSENFRWRRSVIGNSLGNFRWLDASVNRSRGNGNYVALEGQADLVQNPDEWNKIILQNDDKCLWSKDDVATFQRLIDLRTLDLYENLLTESGIEILTAG